MIKINKEDYKKSFYKMKWKERERDLSVNSNNNFLICKDNKYSKIHNNNSKTSNNNICKINKCFILSINNIFKINFKTNSNKTIRHD